MRYLILLAVFILAGCGQKGALYLPENKPQAVQEQPKTQSATSTTQASPKATN